MFLHRTPPVMRSEGDGGNKGESPARRSVDLARYGNSVDVLIHELKQPLLCILVLGERLENMLKGVSADAFPKAAVAKRDIAALLVSVQQMRDVMSARSALANLTWVSKDWSSRFNSQLEALNAVAGTHGVTIKVVNGLAEREEGPDLAALGQVLSNLVTNAIHALEDQENGPKEVLIEIGEERATLRVRVHDSGKGVPTDIMNKIFTKGFSTKQARGGSGYGLWVCRKLAEALGGSIAVERSDKLGGACFVVEAPLAMPPENLKLDSVA